MNTVHFLNGKTAFSISETLRRWGREEKQQAKNHKTKDPQKAKSAPAVPLYKGNTKMFHVEHFEKRHTITSLPQGFLKVSPAPAC